MSFINSIGHHHRHHFIFTVCRSQEPRLYGTSRDPETSIDVGVGLYSLTSCLSVRAIYPALLLYPYLNRLKSIQLRARILRICIM